MTDAGAVTRPGSLFGWDPFRPFLGLANTGVFAAHLTAFITLRQLVLGRRLAVRLDTGELVLTLVEFDSRVGMRGMAVGQLNDVRLVADQVRWNQHRFGRAIAVLHNVQLRPSVPPVLVAAPVELTLDVPARSLDELFRWAAPRLSGEVGPDGVARLRFANRREAGHVEVETRLDGSTLWLKPTAITRRRRWKLPARTPAYRVQLPPLPHGLQLTGVEFDADVVRLRGTLPEWRTELPRTRLDDVIDQLSVVGRPLNLIWPSKDA
ncbi:MAG: hypothetical protein QOJ28_3204 [Mycobacterium sp.]|jgi:hypothetical protein|nr:hypothetical protein [Mycobacterium sp.]